MLQRRSVSLDEGATPDDDGYFAERMTVPELDLPSQQADASASTVLELSDDAPSWFSENVSPPTTEDDTDTDVDEATLSNRGSPSTTSSPGDSRCLNLQVSPLLLPRRLGIRTNSHIGDYRLGKTLGEGAFAKVKVAIHEPSGHRVAIKILTKSEIKEDYVIRNLYREGSLLKRLAHPNIISLYETIETDDHYCIVTELAEGGEVLDYIVAHKRLPEKETRKYIGQLISSVEHMHANDVVHRDLKAENLLLDANLDIKIIDFGLGNDASDNVLRTQCGSPAYGAPELIGGKSYGKEVDIWSIGINMYAMLTGKLPFPSASNMTKLHAMMLEGKYAIPDNLSEDGVDVLRSMLKVKPKDRISIPELKAHPWFKGHEWPRPVSYSPGSVDSDVVEDLVKLGYDAEDIAESVTDRACNELFALYNCMSATKSKRARRSAPKSMKRTSSDTRLLKPEATTGIRAHVSQSATPGSRLRRQGSSRLKSLPEERAKKADDRIRTSVSPPTSPAPPTDAPPLRRGSMDSARIAAMRGRRSGSLRRLRRTSDCADAGPVEEQQPSGRRDSSTSNGRPRLTRRSSQESVMGLQRPNGANSPQPPAYQNNRRRMTLASLHQLPPQYASRGSEQTSPDRGVMAADSARPSRTPKSAPRFRRSSSSTLTVTDTTAASAPSTRAVSPVRPRRSSISADTTSASIRTIRCPLGEHMISQKKPDVILREIQTAVQQKCTNITMSSNGAYCVTCTFGAVVLEVEVVRVPNLSAVYGVHFSRLKGDSHAFQRACNILLAEMSL